MLILGFKCVFFAFFVLINPKFQKEKYFLKATLELGNVHS